MDYLIRIGSVDIECASPGAVVKLVHELRGRYATSPHDRKEERRQLIIEWLKEHGSGSKSQILRDLDIPIGGLTDIFNCDLFEVSQGKVVLAVADHIDDEDGDSEDTEPVEPLTVIAASNKDKVIAALREHPGSSASELAEHAELTATQVKAVLYNYRRTEFKRSNEGRWSLLNDIDLASPKDDDEPEEDEAGDADEQEPEPEPAPKPKAKPGVPPQSEHLNLLKAALKKEQPADIKELSNLTGIHQADVFKLLNNSAFEKDGNVYWLAKGEV